MAGTYLLTTAILAAPMVVNRQTQAYTPARDHEASFSNEGPPLLRRECALNLGLRVWQAQKAGAGGLIALFQMTLTSEESDTMERIHRLAVEQHGMDAPKLRDPCIKGGTVLLRVRGVHGLTSRTKSNPQGSLPGGMAAGSAYGIRTRDLRLERAVS